MNATEALLCVLFLGGGVASVTAVPITAANPSPVHGISTDSVGIDDVVVKNSSLSYSGSKVDRVTVILKSTRLLDVDGNVTVRVKTLSGTVVSSGSSSELVSASDTTEFVIDIAPDVGVDNYGLIRITVT